MTAHRLIALAALLPIAAAGPHAAAADREAPNVSADPATPWKDAGVVATASSPFAALAPVPIHAVTLRDGFWRPRLKANRKASISTLLAQLEMHGVVDNFRRLSGRKQCDRRGPLFTDSDLYKWMEAAALVLQSADDKRIHAALDKIIDVVVAAQHEDGYLHPYSVDDRADTRFTKLETDHELYCAGHFFQAAVAHYRATGSRKLLDPALRFADYLCSMFGPGKPVQGHPGHAEIEMALVELYRTTGERKYLDLAKYYLDDDHYTKHDGVTGHAVRMMYFCAGGTDYVIETGDQDYWNTTLRLWNDMVTGKMYVTGGLGSRPGGEAFGDPYELPNDNAYAETCAAIGNVYWQWRLLAAAADARYADVLERTLYNGFLSGVALEGTEYFYVNPLACNKVHQRQPWYDCTCCPPNVERMLAALPGFFFSTSKTGLYVHFYDNCTLDWHLADGTRLQLAVDTHYPWDQKVSFELKPEKPTRFELNLRIPGWCRDATVDVNGERADAAVTPATYCRLAREWKPGDRVTLDLPMPVAAVAADDRVADDRGSVAVMRGPIVYCFEGVDHPNTPVESLRLLIDPETRRPMLSPDPEPELLGGVTVLHGRGVSIPLDVQPLYYPLDAPPQSEPRPVDLTAVPYYAWANRGPAAMRVWIPYVYGERVK